MEEPSTYGERLLALDEESRIDALVGACERALVAWMLYAVRAKPRYVDGVVGLEHVVDVDLPTRALEEVRTRHELPEVGPTVRAFVEPVVALQDGDLVLPKRVEHAFYAIYNLHRLVFEPSDALTPFLVLSQATAAIVDGDDEGATMVALDTWWRSWR